MAVAGAGREEAEEPRARLGRSVSPGLPVPASEGRASCPPSGGTTGPSVLGRKGFFAEGCQHLPFLLTFLTKVLRGRQEPRRPVGECKRGGHLEQPYREFPGK